MDLFDIFMNKHFQFIFIFLICTVSSYMFGRLIGELKSIRDDFKSLDYDNLKFENEELKRLIEIIKK